MSATERDIPDFAGAWKSPDGEVLALVVERGKPYHCELLRLTFFHETNPRFTIPTWGVGSLSIRWDGPEFRLLPEPLQRTLGMVPCDPQQAWHVMTGAPMVHADPCNWASQRLTDLRRMLAEPHYKAHAQETIEVSASWLMRVKQLIADVDGVAENEQRVAHQVPGR